MIRLTINILHPAEQGKRQAVIICEKVAAASGKQLDGKDDEAKQEDEDADTVDTVHVPDPFFFWTIRVFLFEVEVFRYLFPDSHGGKIITCINSFELKKFSDLNW